MISWKLIFKIILNILYWGNSHKKDGHYRPFPHFWKQRHQLEAQENKIQWFLWNCPPEPCPHFFMFADWSVMWERSTKNSSRKQQVYDRKSLTYHYIEIIIFCGHWCTCYLNIQHPPCTTHINHRSVTYWTSIPPKTKKWLTRSRGEKMGFTKT